MASRSSVPAGLHVRGKALWVSLGVEAGTALGELALEACRTADRLEELDRIIAGKGVMQLMQFRLDHIDWEDAEQHIHVRVGFQSVLQEARLQQLALKDLLKDVRAIKAQAPALPKPGAASAAATGLDMLAVRRAGRESTTA